MKNISKLQNEIRIIKKDLSNIEVRLEGIDEELSNYKDSSVQSSKDNNIYELAQTFPRIDHPISKENRTVKNNYFSILLMISTIDDSINNEQLLFLQRIALSDEQNSRLDSYLANLGNINFKNVLFKLDETVKNNYSKQLLLDMIILSNLSTSDDRKSYEIIASISAFLGVDKQVVREISQIAKAILLNNGNYLPDSENNKCFDYYLCKLPGYHLNVDIGGLSNFARIFFKREHDSLIDSVLCEDEDNDTEFFAT